MEITSYTKYLRISNKKLQGVAKTVIGLDPQQAIDRLLIASNKGGQLLARVIKTALSNATNNHKLDASTLRISRVELGKGPVFKRFQPVSRGMAHQIKKRTSHIKVVLKEVLEPKNLPVKQVNSGRKDEIKNQKSKLKITKNS